MIRSTYDSSTKTTELEVLRPVMKADLLVLDDLGAERLSEWVEETMNLIVNTRYNERRLTIFTSNYEDIPDDTDPNSLLFRIGHRMRSRLHEMCDFVSHGRRRLSRNLPSTAASTTSDHALEERAAPETSGARRPSGARASSASPVRDGRADLKWPGGRAGS